MPVFTDDKLRKKFQKNQNFKPKQSLTSWNKSLTGSPTRFTGYFNSSTKTLNDLFKRLSTKFLIGDTNMSPQGSLQDITLEQQSADHTWTTNEITALAQIYKDLGIKPFTKANHTLSLIGFETVKNNAFDAKVKMESASPIFLMDQDTIFKASENNYLTQDPFFEIPEYLDQTMQDITKDISLEDIYEQAMTIYFHTKIDDVLTLLLKYGKTMTTKNVLNYYKAYNTHIHQFNSVQNSTIVYALQKNVTDPIAFRQQLLNESPDLMFANLSASFGQLSTSFDPLVAPTTTPNP